MIAYHGSPHRFDAFRLDRIGTGEGFQTFGHGVYLAASRGAAEVYGTGWRLLIDGELSQTSTVTSAGRVRSCGTVLVDNLLRVYLGDVDAIIAWAADPNRKPIYGHENADVGMIEAAAKSLRGRVEIDHSGFLYTVLIEASRDELIDLNAPLRSQPAQVKALLEPALRRLSPVQRHLLQGDDRRLAVAFQMLRKHGAPIEPRLSALGCRGFMVISPRLRTRIFTLFDPDDCQIVSVEKVAQSCPSALPQAR